MTPRDHKAEQRRELVADIVFFCFLGLLTLMGLLISLLIIVGLVTGQIW